MYNPGDPRRLHILPSHRSAAAPYPASLENSQLSITSPPAESSYLVFMQPPFNPQLTSLASPSNSATDFSNTRLLAPEVGYRPPLVDPFSSSASGAQTNSFALNTTYSLVKTAPAAAQPTPYASANTATVGASGSYAGSYASLPTVLSQPGSPHLTSSPSVMQPRHVLQSQQQQQQQASSAPPGMSQPSFTYSSNEQSFAPLASQPPAPRTVMLFTTDVAPVPAGSFFAVPTAPSQLATAMHSGQAQQVTYMLNAAATNPGLVTYAPHPETFHNWQTLPAVPQPPPQPTQPTFFPGPPPPGGQHAGQYTAYTAQPAPATPPSAAPAQVYQSLYAVASLGANAAGGGATPAAGGSPGGSRPAALGVRSFLAPKPVGSCLVSDASLITTVPPLALPPPVWGKLPAAEASSGRARPAPPIPS